MSKSAFTETNDLFRALLKELRLKKGLTQADVAIKLGVPQSYVSKVEIGERRMDFAETAAFCEAIGTSISGFATAFEKRATKSRGPAGIIGN